MQSILKVLSFTITIFFISSCGKLAGEFYLTAEEKSQIPFQGFETISFIDDSNNIIVVQAGDRTTKTYETLTCTQCSDYVITESEHIQFSNHNISMYFSLSTTKYTYASNSFGHGIGIDSIGFSHAFASPLAVENLRLEESHYDSLLVNNTMYYNIFSDTLTHIGMIELTPYPVRMYYSTKFGVIKYDFSDGSTWKLEKIEWTE